MSIFQSPNSQRNQSVTNLENRAFHQSNFNHAFQTLRLTDDTAHPQRPAFGTQGQKIELLANYFELLKKDQSVVFHWYYVSVGGRSENETPKGKKLARLIKLFIQEHLKKFFVVSDYSTTIISNVKYPFQQSSPTQQEFSVTYRDEDGREDPAERNRTYRMLLQYSKPLDPNDLLTYLTSPDRTQQELSTKQDIIQAMNIIIGYSLKGATTQIMSRSNKYVPYLGNLADKRFLGSGVEMFRGYSFSVRPATGRILLNTQVKHQATLVSQSLPSLYRALGVDRNSREDTLRKAERIIKGARVKLTHFQPNRNKTVLGFATPEDGAQLPNRPRGLRYGATADEIKILVDGRWVTVNQYFHQKHNKKSSLPVVNTGTRTNPVYTIAEVCHIPPGVPFRARFDGEQSKNMIEYAVRPPVENATSITGQGVKLLGSGSLNDLQSFGWAVNPNLVKIQGRVLNSPRVMYIRDNRKNPLQISFAQWNMARSSFVDGKAIPLWAAVWVTVGTGQGRNTGAVRSINEVDSLINNFCETLQKCGLSYNEFEQTTELNVVREEDCKEKIRGIFMRASQAKLKLLLFVLPKASTPIYNAIKQAGDIGFGIHTVCVVGSKFCKPHNEQYFANVALKFNLKLGGRNQELNETDLGFIAKGKTMLVGIDVTHPAPGEDRAPSVACIVASVDKNCAQWPAHIRVQPPRQEMVRDNVLKDMFKTRLKYWQQQNKTFPEQILIYRDGVGEGQYGLVRDFELGEIRKACNDLYPADQTKNNLPRITIVIVGKRHNTRFYPTAPASANRGNTKSGTVVDSGITELRVWDFYLQAHTAIKGTARPAHYVVVHDEIFKHPPNLASPTGSNDTRTSGQRAADTLESITHNLCYLYGRATKAVSICPPAYYADIACERARRWLSRLYSDYTLNTAAAQQATTQEVTVHPNLENTMFYI